jgi:hypothetical protein
MLLRSAVWLAVLLTWLLPTSICRADLFFEFGVGGVPTSTIQLPGVGATVPIDVYLRQTTGLLTTEGLLSVGIKVTFDDPSVAAVLNVGDIEHNPDFDDIFGLSKVVNPLSAELSMVVSDVDTPIFPTTGDADRIWLGRFKFTGLSLGKTSIGVTDLDGNSDDIVSGVGNVLDDLITAGTGTLQVVPEPGSVALSLVLLGGASVVAAVRRRRRRQGKDKADPT